MKICNYCGTGMDNRAHKCPFCGQDMTVRGAIKYEDNLPFNGSLDVYSTKHLRKDPAVEDRKSWLTALSAKKTQYKKSTGATYDAAYTEGKQMQEKYAASQKERQQERQIQKQKQKPKPKHKSKKSAKRSGIITAVIAFFVTVSIMMAVCDSSLDLDNPFFYNDELMYAGSLTDNTYSNTDFGVSITLPSDWALTVPELATEDALSFTDLEGNNADSTVRVTYAAESIDIYFESDYEAAGSPAVYENANSYLVSQKAELDATGNYATMDVETAQLNGKTLYLLHYSTGTQYFVQAAAETSMADIYVVIEFSSSNFYAINELLSHISFTD